MVFKENAHVERFRQSSFGNFIEFLGGLATLIGDCARSIVRRPPTFNSITHELYEVGVKSFIIVAVAALAVGLVMAIQFGFGLARFGAKLYVPKVVTISIVRELGPIFTALMVAGRVGAGIASELGSMKVTQQIDAMRALGTDPLQKLITPKIIACTLALPMLAIIADILGVFGGMAISGANLGLSGYDYFFKAFEIITRRDVIGGVAKAVFFGFIIGTVGCWYGLNTTGGTQGVGNSTTKSVVTSSVFVVFFDFVLTKAIWLIESAIKSGQI